MISVFQSHTRWRFYSYHRIPNCFTQPTGKLSVVFFCFFYIRRDFTESYILFAIFI